MDKMKTVIKLLCWSAYEGDTLRGCYTIEYGCYFCNPL